MDSMRSFNIVQGFFGETWAKKILQYQWSNRPSLQRFDQTEIGHFICRKKHIYFRDLANKTGDMSAPWLAFLNDVSIKVAAGEFPSPNRFTQRLLVSVLPDSQKPCKKDIVSQQQFW